MMFPRTLNHQSLAQGVSCLCKSDSDLARIVSDLGHPPLWARQPGFATLLQIILEQQVSLASARAAYQKLEKASGQVTPERFLTFTDAKLKQFCAVWPSDRSIKQIKHKIRITIGRRYDKSLEEMIEILNPIIRGWNNYHRKAKPVMKRLQKLNGFVRDRLRIFLRRKYSDQSRGTRRVHDSLLVRLGLYQFG